MNNNKYNPYLILVVSVMTISWSPLLTRWSEAPGVITSFFRMFIGVVALSIPFLRKRSSYKAIKAQHIFLAVFAGIAFALDNAFWATGVTLAGASNPTFLVNTSPIWVGLGATLFFREQLGNRFWFGLVLALAGSALILEVDWSHSVMSGAGSLYGLIGGLFYAIFLLVGQKSRYYIDTVPFFFIVLCSSTCVLGIIALIFQYPFGGYSLSTYIIFVLLGTVMTAGAWLAITYSLGKLSAAIVAPIMLGQPVITAVLAHYILLEELDHLQIIGATAVLIGVILTQNTHVLSHDEKSK
jgi:drug/metabolite transporter (DMT)-like permease